MRFALRRFLPALATLLAACASGTDPIPPQDPRTVTYDASLGINLAQMTERTTGLFVQDVTTGTGLQASNGRTLTMHYTGWLTNGRKFDSSRDRNQPFDFTLGTGQVIRGWDLGVEGMRVGGRRRLVIAPSLGYGNQANGPIPAGSVLVFDVELLGVR